MPKYDKYNFSKIEEAYNDYMEAAARIMRNYRTMSEIYKKESANYKDEIGFYNQKMKTERERARANLEPERIKFQNHVTNCVIALKACVSSDIMTLPNADFAKTLGTLNDMSLELTQLELEGLIKQANGNYMALRSIAKLAEKSGYKLNFPTLEDLTKSLKPYEIAASKTAVCPDGYIKEACEIFGNEPTPYTAEDGTVKYTNNKLTTPALFAASFPVKVCADTSETVEMWSKVTPSLDKIVKPAKVTPTLDETEEPVEVEVTHAPGQLPNLDGYRPIHPDYSL